MGLMETADAPRRTAAGCFSIQHCKNRIAPRSGCFGRNSVWISLSSIVRESSVTIKTMTTVHRHAAARVGCFLLRLVSCRCAVSGSARVNACFFAKNG